MICNLIFLCVAPLQTWARGETIHLIEEHENEYKSRRRKKKSCGGRNAAEPEQLLQCIVSEVNAEWLVRRCLKHTVPPVRACSSSVRKTEMRNASERRFKRQSSVIGNDRHTQSIHHSWPFHFSLSFFSPFSSLSPFRTRTRKVEEELESTSLRRLCLIQSLNAALWCH